MWRLPDGFMDRLHSGLGDHQFESYRLHHDGSRNRVLKTDGKVDSAV